MKRILLIILVISIAGCGKRTSIVPKVNPVIKYFEDNKAVIEDFGEKVFESQDEISNKSRKILDEIESFEKEYSNYHLKVNSTKDEEIVLLRNMYNPAYSSGENFIAAIERESINHSSGKEEDYKLKVIHNKSKNSTEIFAFDNSFLPNKKVSNFFNLYSWHPALPMLAVTGNEKKGNNVYLAGFVYDESDNNIKYSIVRITDYDERYSLMNYNWRKDGQSFTFTRYDGEHYKVFEFDIEDQELREIENKQELVNEQELVSFIYDNYRYRSGFAIIRDGEGYHPLYVKKVKNGKITQIRELSVPGLMQPTIFSAFCETEEKIGIYGIDENRENSFVAFYDYRFDKLENCVTKNELDYGDYLVQLTPPIWLQDRLLVFNKSDGVSYIDTNDKVIEKNGRAVVKDIFVSKDEINSISLLDENNLIYSYRESDIVHSAITEIKLNEYIPKSILVAKIRRVRIKNITKINDKEGTLEVSECKTRKGSYDALLGLREGVNTIFFDSQDIFEKALEGDYVYLAWSIEIEKGNISASYKILVNEEIPYQNIVIVP